MSLRCPPLVPVAIAITIGIVADRLFSIPPLFLLAIGVACMAAWLIVRSDRTPRLAVGYLLGAVAAFGGYLHHRQQHPSSPLDIGRHATKEGTAIRLRGRVAAPPSRVPGIDDPMQSIPRPEATRFLLDVTHLSRGDDREPAEGFVTVYVAGTLIPIFPGDELEVQGRLIAPSPPSNPGENDATADARDLGVRAIVSTPATPDALRLVARRWPASLSGWLGWLHHHCKTILYERLSAEPALATALLLGDGSGMTGADWEKFVRSGIVHAIAISGQHLVVLAGFLGLLRRVVGLRLRTASIAIALALTAYALLTGGRAPVMRAAWVMLALCLGMFLRRPPLPASSFALAWVGVALTNPADLFSIGCQLSFLAVFLLRWAVNPLMERKEIDPLDAIELEYSPWPIRVWRAFRGELGKTYFANAVVWIGVTPLIAAKFHMVSPIALLIGPPVVVLTSLALLSGFMLLLTAPLLGPLSAPFAWATDASLFGCEWLVDVSLKVPGAFFYLAEVPDWWILTFYILLGAIILLPMLRRRWIIGVGLAWLILGLTIGLGYWRRGEFRVAFLAVGHGGCTVIETPGGRTLVYDAGAMTGPDIVRRYIAPYLWSRGIRRIDDIYLSHADLDHFSGVPGLLERFDVRRITTTPSFADRVTPAVKRVVADWTRRGIPIRIVKTGDADTIDDLRIDVLHPPARGPEGKENVRSMVLWVRLGTFSTLLTGDLEEAGMEQVLATRPIGIDLLMAPHHGSRFANTAEFAAWTKPRYVISCQGRPRSLISGAAAYEKMGAVYLTTWKSGALILTRTTGDFTLSAFRSKESWRLGPAPVR